MFIQENKFGLTSPRRTRVHLAAQFTHSKPHALAQRVFPAVEIGVEVETVCNVATASPISVATLKSKITLFAIEGVGADLLSLTITFLYTVKCFIMV